MKLYEGIGGCCDFIISDNIHNEAELVADLMVDNWLIAELCTVIVNFSYQKQLVLY